MVKKTSLVRREMRGTFEAVRAEALFLSTLQPSASPSPDQIRRAVAEIADCHVIPSSYRSPTDTGGLPRSVPAG